MTHARPALIDEPLGRAGAVGHARLASLIQALRSARRNGTLSSLLAGRHFALVVESRSSESANLFECAALELGARVSRLQPSRLSLSSAAATRHTGQTLQMLYDAVECIDMAAHDVERLRGAANIPVFDGLAVAAHDDAAIADHLLIIQAILIEAKGTL